MLHFAMDFYLWLCINILLLILTRWDIFSNKQKKNNKKKPR